MELPGSHFSSGPWYIFRALLRLRSIFLSPGMLHLPGRPDENPVPRGTALARLVLSCLGLICVQCQALFGPVEPPHSPWELQMYPVETNWSDYEEGVPMVIASVPEDVPQEFVLPGVLAPGDQGSHSSGTAWAVGYSAFSYLVRTKRGQTDYVCSAAYIFNSLNRGRNQAISVLASLQLLEEQGCPHEKHMPYRFDDYVYKPGRLAQEDAARYKVNGFGRVDFQDSDQMKAHLLQGSLVILRMRISENFVNHKGREWRVPAGKEVGSQTLVVVGYDDTRGVYIVQNSAGGTWGEYGRTGVPLNWFVRLAEKAYVLW